MKGLLIKDFYTLTKQLQIFLLYCFFFANAGFQQRSFAFVYSAMLQLQLCI